MKIIKQAANAISDFYQSEPKIVNINACLSTINVVILAWGELNVERFNNIHVKFRVICKYFFVRKPLQNVISLKGIDFELSTVTAKLNRIDPQELDATNAVEAFDRATTLRVECKQN